MNDFRFWNAVLVRAIFIVAVLTLAAWLTSCAPVADAPAVTAETWTKVVPGYNSTLYKWDDRDAGVICYRLLNPHDDTLSCVAAPR